MAFGDHLRADKQVQFACVQRVQNAFEIGMATDGVTIETCDSRLRKKSVQQFF